MTISTVYIPVRNTVSNTAAFGNQSTQSASFANTLKSSLISSGSVNLDAIFDAAGRKYNISPDLLKAVAKVESNFKADVVSRAGAMGIMQLMPGTARGLGVDDPFDPEQNIMGGAKYLKAQLDRFDGNVELALAAYNAGPGAVNKYGGIPPYKETQAYVPKVLSYLGGNITAGTLTYNGYDETAAPTAELTQQYIPYTVQISNSVPKDSPVNFNEFLTQMLLFKLFELQMSSPGDNKRTGFGF